MTRRRFRACRTLGRSETGATAIEYAVIAGLIGIGLIGSLVTTRGSLSAVFGTASGRMNSAVEWPAVAGGNSPFDPANPRASYWAAKIIDGSPKTTAGDGYTATTISFKDGSVYSLTRMSDGSFAVSAADTQAQSVAPFSTDSNGVPIGFSYFQFSDAGMTALDFYYSTQNYVNGTPSEVATTRCPGGNCVRVTGAPDAAFMTTYQNAVYDLALFKAIPAN